MLVLERKTGETIRVGEHIEFSICKISGSRVRITTRAPGYCIRRGELALTGGNPSGGNLVLSRKANETIWIGEAICLTVLKVRKNRVSIGIEAPGELRILRGELAA